jgi:NAD+ kinase
VKRVAIYPNLDKPDCAAQLRRLTSWLRRRGLEVLVPIDGTPRPEDRGGPVFTSQQLRGVDLMVVLGGDGTLLSAARAIHPRRVPILGVNFGGLGFLADLSTDRMLPALEAVLAGHYRHEPRMMLRASVVDAAGRVAETVHGLNDIVLHQIGRRAVVIHAVLAGTSLGSFRADGMIVATPTGSTAYSLSAGGPIVEPTLNVLLATPVCPHTLSLRPLVFPAGQVLELRVPPTETEVTLTLDGQVSVPFRPDQSVRVTRAAKPIWFLQAEDRSFYEVLRAKLRWGGA